MTKQPMTMPEANVRRAKLAEEILRVYCEKTGLTLEDDGADTAITDLLGDLMHLCHRDGLDLDDLTEKASGHWAAETFCIECGKLLEDGDDAGQADNACRECIKKMEGA